jgi:hypothetical protein
VIDRLAKIDYLNVEVWKLFSDSVDEFPAMIGLIAAGKEQ